MKPRQAHVDTSTLTALTPEPTAELTLQQDGEALLERECSQCHVINWLLKIKKSRAEWEKTLNHMSGLGVHMDKFEEGILLDYLAYVEPH